jgi:hypothetical protein
MKVNALIFYFVIILINIHTILSKIDLFTPNKSQNFNSEIDKIKDMKKELFHKSNSSKKSHVLNNLKNLIEKYVTLKSHKKDKKDKENGNLSSQNKFRQIQKLDISKDKSQLPKKELKEEKNTDFSQLELLDPNHNLKKLSEEELERSIEGSRIKMFPYNLIINKPDLIVNNPDKPVYLDKTLLSKIKINRNLAKNVVTRSIPIEDCNKSWDYLLHGSDWICMCQCGKSQSPINIITDDVETMRDNIFFDFKSPELCSDELVNTCKFPLIRNNGISIDIEDDCGILVMPPHMNGYKCFKIEIHTQSEHKIGK